MTLKTTIIILDPIPAEKLWHPLNAMIGATAGTHTDREPGYIENPPDQSLLGHMWMRYAIDAPLDDRAEYNDDKHHYPDSYTYDFGSYDAWGHHAPVPHAVKISIDTSYGLGQVHGIEAGCNDLHAWLIRFITMWCEQYGARIMWHNEFQCRWYDGTDNLFGKPEKVGAISGAFADSLAPVA